MIERNEQIMWKRFLNGILKLIMILIISAVLVACGKTYTCSRCDKKTKDAYYKMSMKEESVLCEDCARKYWAPFPYDTYKVE